MLKSMKKCEITSGGVGKFNVIFTYVISNAHGALIVFRERLSYEVLSSDLKNISRYVILKVEIQSSLFILINC